MPSNGVQLRGVSSIMSAFDNLKIAAWSIMYGRNINMKYAGNNFAESRNTLQGFLDLLKDSDTTAMYTLHIYEDLPKGGKIKLSTEPDYSFNFLVTEEEAPRHARNREILESNRILMDKVTALEARLAAREEDDDDEQPVGSLGAMLSGLLDDDKFKDWIRTKAIGLADKFFNNPQNANVIPMDRAIGKVGAVTQDDPILINEQQRVKMTEAIEILARVDPKLGDNLMKLAKIAESDPGKYNTMAAML